MMGENAFRLFALAVVAVALVFVWSGVALARSGWRRQVRSREDRSTWVSRPARIVGWQGRWMGPGASNDRYFFPEVEYDRPDGTTGRFTNPTGRGHVPWRLRKGGPATVLVDPADPGRAELAHTQADRNLLGISHVVMGAVFAVAGLAIAVLTVAVWVWVE